MQEILLKDSTSSILWITERSKTDVVIGAPHHTFGGIKQMPCPEHTDGDENTGFIAHAIAEKLNISSLIACNYTIDSNKNLNSDYVNQILKWNPKYLIEIHGHGAKKTDGNTIEISCGSSAKNNLSKRFAKSLESKLKKTQELNIYYVNGDFDKIYFKAKNTATIIHKTWTAYHIELPPSIRLDAQNKLPAYCQSFNNCLVETIRELCMESQSIDI